LKLSTHFISNEFSCKCGCGLSNISQTLINKLQSARYEAGIPFVITSGSRCPAHNKREGGLASSAHITGLAVDIAAPDGLTRYKILNSLMSVGFKRIGIAKSFIHVDIDRTKPSPTIWIY